MTGNEKQSQLSGSILEEDSNLSLAELCRVCRMSPQGVFELVEFGVIEPVGPEPRYWRFSGVSIRRLHRAQRLQRDLGVNTAGVALALDLLDEMETLRSRLQRLEDNF